MAYTTLVTLLLLSIGTIWNADSAESSQCARDPGHPINAVEPANLRAIITRLTVYYNAVKAGSTKQKSLDGQLRLAQIQLNRLHHSWAEYYLRSDPDLLVERLITVDTLHQIDAVQETVKAAMVNSSRLQYLSKLMAQNSKAFPISITPVVELDSVGKQRYYGCATWREMLEAHWQGFLHNETDLDVNRLKQTFQMLKETANQLRQRSTTEKEEIRLANQARMMRLESMFEEYQKWIEKGERSPYGPEYCAKTQYVAGAMQIAKQLQARKSAFYLAYKLHLGTSDLYLAVGLSLRLAEEFSREFTEDMKALVSANFTARYLSLVQLAQLDALVQFMHRTRIRAAFYAEQKKDYFDLPRAIDPLPFETVIAENEYNVQREGIARAHQCQMWSEVLEEQWKRYEANPGGNATNTVALRETFQALKQTALQSMDAATKLAKKVPNDNSRYLRGETELAILTLEKVNQRLVDFFDEYLKLMNKAASTNSA